MAQEQMYLINAQDQAHQYTQRINEAMASENPDEMRFHVQESMLFGQNALDNLEEAVTITEDPDMADHIDEAINHLGLSMDQADQAIEASDEELDDLLPDMVKHANQSLSFLSEAMSVAM